MLQDSDGSLQSSPQRYQQNVHFIIEPDLLIDEADEEHYKKKQQSHVDIQVNSGKHLVPRFPSSQLISKSSSQITQFSVDMKRQAQTQHNNHLNINYGGQINYGQMGYSMQSSINSDAMKNLIKDAQQYQNRGSFNNQHQQNQIQEDHNHDHNLQNNNKLGKHARQYSHQFDNSSSVLIASISLDEDNQSYQQLKQNQFGNDIHQQQPSAKSTLNQNNNLQNNKGSNYLQINQQQKTLDLNSSSNLNNYLYQNMSNIQYDMNSSQSLANTQVYNNIQQPTLTNDQSTTKSIKKGYQFVNHSQSVTKHKKNKSMNHTNNQKSFQILPRTSHQDFESMLQYIKSSKNHFADSQNSSVNHNLNRSSSQNIIKSNNAGYKQKQNTDNQYEPQHTATTASFGLKKSPSHSQVKSQSQLSSIHQLNQTINISKKLQFSHCKSNSKSNIKQQNTSNLNSTLTNSNNAVNINSLMKSSITTSNFQQSQDHNSNNSQMYFQNLNDLLQNKIKDQMQTLIQLKKDLQQKVKEQQLINIKEQQNLQSQLQTEQMLNTELKHVFSKQSQSDSLNKELEDNIQSILMKQQEKKHEYQQEQLLLQNLLNQQQEHYNEVQMQHQHERQLQHNIKEQQQEQIYQLELHIVDCDEQLLDMNMQHKQISQNEDNLTKLVKENNNQMSRIITIDHVDNMMLSTKNNTISKSQIGKQMSQTIGGSNNNMNNANVSILNSSINLNSIIKTGGISTNKSSARSSIVHTRSQSKNNINSNKNVLQQSNLNINRK